MWLGYLLFVFLILFVVQWIRTDEVTYQISAGVFLILIYVQSNSVDLHIVMEQNEQIIELLQSNDGGSYDQ